MPAIKEEPPMKQYQVIFLDKQEPQSLFAGSGVFDAQAMQDTLNVYAIQGWRVVSCVSLSTSNGSTDKFVVVLEQDA
jgi:hypothetical protein